MSKRHPYPRHSSFSKPSSPPLTPHQIHNTARTETPSLFSSSHKDQSLPTHADEAPAIIGKTASDVLNWGPSAALEVVECTECGFSIPVFVADSEKVKEEGCPICNLWRSMKNEL